MSFDAVRDSYPVVTMPVAFGSTDYIVSATPLTRIRTGNNPQAGSIGAGILSNSAFILKFYGATNAELVEGWAWHACGY